jgi:hypothetical protein
MATVRQAKLAKAIVENSKRDKPLNKKELLVSVGYSPITADVKQGEIMEQKGVKEELEILGFTEHAAMKVVDEIMNDKNVDPSARLKATDQVFKVRGTYAPERSIVANIHVNEEKQQRSKQLIRGILGNREDIR